MAKCASFFILPYTEPDIMVIDDVLSFVFDLILGRAHMLIELSIIKESDSPDFYSCRKERHFQASSNLHRWPNLDRVVESRQVPSGES